MSINMIPINWKPSDIVAASPWANNETICDIKKKKNYYLILYIMLFESVYACENTDMPSNQTCGFTAMRF